VTDAICTIDGCSRTVHGRGLCGAHWNRLARHGDPLGGAPERLPATRCITEGCDRKSVARGLCGMHDKRRKLLDDPEYRERKNAAWREWATSHKAELSASARDRREANPERRSELLAEWRANNPAAALTHGYQRRRRRSGLPDDITESVDPDVVFERDRGICQLCRLPVDPDLVMPHPMCSTTDHVIPVVDARCTHSYANVQLAHWDCNRRKNRTVPDDADLVGSGG
jgi:5-methylcytosine-specific restriction endonuclease McrA